MSRIYAIIQELESTESVADFVATAGAVATDDEDNDEDDKTLSQKDDKRINVPLGAHYLALSLAISQRANFVSYLCNVNDERYHHREHKAL